MRPTRAAVGALALGLILGLQSAHGHVKPSVNSNNRYYKLTPMGDRVRLAYTVYMGQVPGAQTRRRLDTNRDGTLDDAESKVFGDQIGQAVRQGLQIEIDGQRYAVSWDQIYVGLGTPTTAAGAFSVDLIAWLCLRTPAERRRHTLVLFDRFHVPRPGETELRVEASPGIEILRSTLGADGRTNMLDFKWNGAPGHTATEGFYLQFNVDPATAAFTPDGMCPGAGAAQAGSANTGGTRGLLWIILIGCALAVCAAIAVLARRRAAAS